MVDDRPQADRILVAQLTGEARHRARWRELNTDEEAGAVQALSELAGGRADLLAQVAGIFEGTSEGEPDERLARSAARLCRKAGPTRRRSRGGSRRVGGAGRRRGGRRPRAVSVGRGYFPAFSLGLPKFDIGSRGLMALASIH
jgi:hypothetical protein